MSALYLTLGALPGSTIDDTTRDACAVANRLGIAVWYEFNTVHVYAHPGDDPLKLGDALQRALNDPHAKFPVAKL